MKFNSQTEKITGLISKFWITNRERIELVLDSESIESQNRKVVYEASCNEPWKTMLWCSLSLNNKGSASKAMPWHSKFHDILNYLSPSQLKENYRNDEQRFIAMNIIARHFAGGRMLTCSQDKGITYINKEERIDRTLIKKKVEDSYLFKIELYLENKSSADITNLFLEWQLLRFDEQRINEYYSNLELKNLSAEDLSYQIGDELKINKKYSRNILMDMRLNKAEYNFAIDSRIDNILNKIKFESSSFNAKEKFLKSVLKNEVLKKIIPNYSSRPSCLFNQSITGWELDRLLFRFNDELLNL